MKILKGYVRNRNRPEGCIIECYVAEEAVQFCSEYLESAQTIGIPKSLECRQNVPMGFKVTPVEYKMLREAHFYVLQKTLKVDCYRLEHLSYIRALHSAKARGEKWLQAEHRRCFIPWFR